ncbi:MAG: hypothetical protein ACYDBB_20660 [Armatimonadota bacterium]
MRQLIGIVGVIALLWSASTVGAHVMVSIAQNDARLLDISVRNADVGDVLSALFNSTSGARQLRMGHGVAGNIARLQLAGVPFDEVLNAVLAKAGTFEVEKATAANNMRTYTITAPQNLDTPPVLVAPVSVTPVEARTPAASPPPVDINSVFSFAARSTAGDSAAQNDISVIKLLQINFLDIEAFCDAVGGTAISLFDPGSYGGDTNNNTGYNNGGYGSGRGYNSRGNGGYSTGLSDRNYNQGTGYNRRSGNGQYGIGTDTRRVY